MTMPAGASVLVVDDEEDTCHNLSDILTDLGYRVDIATSGPAALELVRKTAYDVALLDLRMPGMDGLTLYGAIKKVRAGTVAIIVTAYAGGSTAEEALAAGAWQVLPKPVDFGRLLSLVDQAVVQPMVLVVDDDPDLCSNLWDLLRQRGYRVALAHNQREADAQLRDSAFRLVLIDLNLPEGDGHDVFRRVRANHPAARTILITGHRSDSERAVEKVLQEGADAVCYKPFDIPALLAQVQQLTQ